MDRPVIDLCWKVSHGVLYTAERLAGFGYALSTACFCSAPVESLQHLFFHCPLAVSVLSWLQSVMFLASPLCHSILVRETRFAFSADDLSVVPRVFVYMLNVCKFCIWGARNDFRFRGVRPSAGDVMERVKSRVRFNLPLFFRRFRSDRRRRYLVRQWGARGVVASLQNDALVVHIYVLVLCCVCVPWPFFWGEPTSCRWMSLLTGGLLWVAFRPCAGSCLFWFLQLFLSLFCRFVELSFRGVSQARHLLDAILRLSVCLLFIGRGGVRFPGEVGVLVHLCLR